MSRQSMQLPSISEGKYVNSSHSGVERHAVAQSSSVCIAHMPVPYASQQYDRIRESRAHTLFPARSGGGLAHHSFMPHV